MRSIVDNVTQMINLTIPPHFDVATKNIYHILQFRDLLPTFGLKKKRFKISFHYSDGISSNASKFDGIYPQTKLNLMK